MERHELKMIAAILGVVATLSIATGVYLGNKNKDLNKTIAAQEARITSMKTQDEQKITALNRTLQQEKENNTTLNNKIKDVNQLLARRDALVNELRILDKKRAEKLDTLETQLSHEKALNDQRQANWDNKRLQLKNDIKLLNEKLLTMVPRSSLTGDGFIVKARKSNNKFTAKAKKVDDLEISFTIPSELTLGGEKTIYLSLTDMKGNSMFTPLITMNVGGAINDESLPIHASKTILFGPETERITFTVNPDEKISAGTYRASVFTKERYLGSVEFPFRDSFWFF